MTGKKSLLKRIGLAAAALAAAALMSARPVGAADKSRSYVFDLSADGTNALEVHPGDELTVTLTLQRADSEERALIRGVQDELYYDSRFIKICADDAGQEAASGENGTAEEVRAAGEAAISDLSEFIETADLDMTGYTRAYYMNYKSGPGGQSVTPETVIGTFRIRITADEGRTAISHRNAMVATEDGSGTYEVSGRELVLTITEAPAAEEEPASSEKEEPVKETAVPKETPEVSEEPVERSSPYTALFILIGLAAALGAIWLILPRRTVTFDAAGGSPVEPKRTVKGRPVKAPAHPVKEGSLFGGWFTEPDGGVRWSFETDRVTEDITLYARWLT